MTVRLAECVIVQPVVRVELDGLEMGLQRFVFAPAVEISLSEAPIAFIRIGRALERALELCKGLRSFSRHAVYLTEGEVRLWEVFVQAAGLQPRCQCLLRPGAALLAVVHREVRVSQTGIGQRKSGIFLEGLLVIFECSFDVLWVPSTV